MKLCETLGMLILNGRCVGDLAGKLTCHTYNGASVIDYAICSLGMYKYIQAFQVQDPCWYSDHCAISLTFKRRSTTDWNKYIPRQDSSCQLEPFGKYKWDENSKELFKAYMQSNEVLNSIEAVTQNLDILTADEACREVAGILKSVAENSCKKIVTTVNEKYSGNVRPEKIPEQFREKLKWVKHNFTKALSIYSERTGDFNRRHTLIKQRKAYKRIEYLIEKY